MTSTTPRSTLVLLVVVLMTFVLAAAAKRDPPTTLQIGVKHKPESCPVKSKNGDALSMQYRGTLFSDGTEFDSSYGRNQPFDFTLGQGQVIQGWDQGLLGMCVGEKRRLTIPSTLAYGERGAGGVIG
ncbi:hypothetical protein BC828DRAFT_391670, partial [Blastocladiella britannica]